MSLRIVLGHFLARSLGHSVVRLGTLIQSLAVVVMKPDDLLKFNRRIYSERRALNLWGDNLSDDGLSVDEAALLSAVPIRNGKLLILGVGGGREAIPLARLGFEVTGVDFLPQMVEKLRENAARQGLQIEGLIQDISELEVPPESYDIIWFSTFMYSFIPTRRKRVQMLKKVHTALRSGGYSVCQFNLNKRYMASRSAEFIRRFFASVTRGNLWYEKGDTIRHNVGFTHIFPSEDGLRSEFEEAGFEVVYMRASKESAGAGAVMKKSL